MNTLALQHLYDKFCTKLFHVLLYTCSRLSLYLCLYDTLWLSCPSSCPTLPFNSSQWHLICVSFARICPASPGVTNLDRASQSASMWARAALLSSKPASTVCRDATAKECQEKEWEARVNKKNIMLILLMSCLIAEILYLPQIKVVSHPVHGGIEKLRLKSWIDKNCAVSGGKCVQTHN